MEAKTVYVVLSSEIEDGDDIFGAFDSKELAEEFVNRFKDRGDGYEIAEVPLNPKCRGNKKLNPYCLAVESDGDASLYIVYDPNDTENAVDNVDILYGTDSGQPPSSMGCYLLAETEDEAWEKGVKRVKELVKRGKFQLEGKISFVNGDRQRETNV